MKMWTEGMSLNGCSWLLCFEVGLIQSIVAMGKLECQLHIDHDFSPNLGDGLVDDSAFLDAVGCRDAAAKGLSNTLDTIGQFSVG